MTSPLPVTPARTPDPGVHSRHGSLAAAFGLVPPDEAGPGDAAVHGSTAIPDVEGFASWRHEIEAFFREARRRIDDYRRDANGAPVETGRSAWRENPGGEPPVRWPRQEISAQATSAQATSRQETPAGPATPSSRPDAASRQDPSDPLMRLQEIQRRLADRLRENV